LFRIRIDEAQALVELHLEGIIREDEMRQFIAESLVATRKLTAQGRYIRVLSDMRLLKAASPEAAEILREGQQTAIESGMRKLAQLVDSELTALQLNRIARASGMDRMMRRFHDEQEARRWLMSDGEQHDTV
jgi:stage II sporulation SpoAA-like protein